jgi:hypothetical protein
MCGPQPSRTLSRLSLGREGWELCWILTEQQLQKEKDGHVLFFKRPLQV